MELRNAGRHQGDAGRKALGRQQLGKAGTEFGQEPIEVEAPVVRGIRFKRSPRRVVHLAGSAKISILEVKQGHRRVNQPFQEPPFVAERFGPELLERIVAVVELAGIELPDSLSKEFGTAAGGVVCRNDTSPVQPGLNLRWKPASL